MTKEQLKHALVSILIGAACSVIISILQVLLDFMKAHAIDLISGASATIAYMSRTYKA